MKYKYLKVTKDQPLTIGEKYRPVAKVKTREEAMEYFEELVQYNMEVSDHSQEQAIDIEKQNIGYYAGYYDRETMQRIHKLFLTSHPIFGEKSPTPTEAFEKGKELGSKKVKKSKTRKSKKSKMKKSGNKK